MSKRLQWRGDSIHAKTGTDVFGGHVVAYSGGTIWVAWTTTEFYKRKGPPTLTGAKRAVARWLDKHAKAKKGGGR